jgi:hypothetical protein
MARTYLVFGDIEGKLDVLRVTRCPRKGRYSVAKLHKFTAEILRSIYKVILVFVGAYLMYQYGLYMYWGR